MEILNTRKVCAKCKEEKPVNDFCVDRHTKDGRRSRCRACVKAHNQYRPTTAQSAVYAANFKTGDTCYSASEWLAQQAAQEHRCGICGLQCQLTLDHKVPIAKGGKTTAENVWGLCSVCQWKKKDNDLERARAYIAGDTATTRCCRRCLSTQPRTAFSKDPHLRDGLQVYCKACCAEYMREYRLRAARE